MFFLFQHDYMTFAKQYGMNLLIWYYVLKYKYWFLNSNLNGLNLSNNNYQN